MSWEFYGNVCCHCILRVFFYDDDDLFFEVVAFIGTGQYRAIKADIYGTTESLAATGMALDFKIMYLIIYWLPIQVFVVNYTLILWIQSHFRVTGIVCKVNG